VLERFPPYLRSPDSHFIKWSIAMPSPLDLILDPVAIAVFAIYAGLILLEALAPARRLPAVPAWKARAIAAFVVYFFLSSYLPLLWTDALAPIQLFDLTALGTWGGAAVGLLVYEALGYAYHRTIHTFTPLWRTFHQMHHSSERLDAYSAFWFSPLDTVGWTFIASLALALAGLTPQAATVVLLAVTLLAVFQHTNVRTPRWLGYFVQRPEAHSYHHERGVHAHNYADLPLFDIVFGTFHNPRDFAPAAGFYDGASLRVLDMLRLRDVSRPDGTQPDSALRPLPATHE